MNTRRVVFVVPAILSLCFAFAVRRAAAQTPPPAVCINELLVANTSTNLDPYFFRYAGWVEIYNPGEEAVDLKDYTLTDSAKKPAKWKIPEGTYVEPKSFCIFWLDQKNVYDHTNFKLKLKGDDIRLYDPKGKLVDSMKFGPQTPDVSYGRKPDGAAALVYFRTPTPNANNTGPGQQTQASATAPQFSPAGGFCREPVSLKLSASSPAGAIRYTLDGSLPRETSLLYQTPVEIKATTVVRARAFEPDRLPSPTVTHTYFINERFTLPVVSISTDPANLWDEQTGIYVKGPRAQQEMPYFGANFLEKWEKPAAVEFFETNGRLGFSLNVGLRTSGTTSLANPAKSFRLYAKSRHGTKEINYRIFPEKTTERYRGFLVRNSGDDWASTVFRDDMIRDLLVGQMDVDFQTYRPAILFLNGQYWGVYYLGEEISNDSLAADHGVDPKQIDLLAYFPDPEKRNYTRVISGDDKSYKSLMGFVKTHDLSIPSNYQYAKDNIDISEYLDYLIVEVYIANADWPGGNVKYWRTKMENGKWRWILFDTDLGFGLYFPVATDMIDFATNPKGPDWPNPPGATFLIRALLLNQEFRNQFAQRFAGCLNTTFRPARVLDFIARGESEIAPEMPRYIARWKGQISDFENLKFPSTMEEWRHNVDGMRAFAKDRPTFMFKHLATGLDLPDPVTLAVTVDPPKGGVVSIEGIAVPSEKFSGLYFPEIPLRIKASANPGYRFTGWRGVPKDTPDSAEIVLKRTTNLKAVFEPVKSGAR